MDQYDKKCNTTVKTPQELEISLKTKINRIYYSAPITQSENVAQKEFNNICRVVFERGHGYAFIVDELSHVCDSYHIEQYHKALLVQGRKFGITHIGGTQRPSALLHKIIYTQSRHKFIFRLDNHDIKVLEKYIGDPIEQTRNLQPYTLLYNSDFENQIIRSVKTT